MSTNLMAASAQWANRPADERFWNLSDLQKALLTRKQGTSEVEMPSKQLRAKAIDNQLCLVGNNGNPAQLSHWSFTRLCTKIEASGEYLRKLPVELAAQCVNYGLSAKANEDKAQLLLQRENHVTTVRSIMTDYDRLWNLDIVNALIPGLSNGWMTPPARPAKNDPRARPATANDIIPNQNNFALAVKEGDMIAPAGVYEGDRDMFIFLVNPTRIIDDGGKGLMRGAFIHNSEVGAGSFTLEMFMLENVCGNHIVWGASKVNKIKLVHRGEKIRYFSRDVQKSLAALMPTDLSAEEKMIQIARTVELGKDKKEVIKLLFDKKSIGATKKDLEKSFDFAEEWEHTAGCTPNTVWGFVHGLTRYSQQQVHADARHKLDVIGGKILSEYVTVA